MILITNKRPKKLRKSYYDKICEKICVINNDDQCRYLTIRCDIIIIEKSSEKKSDLTQAEHAIESLPELRRMRRKGRVNCRGLKALVTMWPKFKKNAWICWQRIRNQKFIESDRFVVSKEVKLWRVRRWSRAAQIKSPVYDGMDARCCLCPVATYSWHSEQCQSICARPNGGRLYYSPFYILQYY